MGSAHQWVPCTVHGTHKSIFPATFSLKIGPMVLFILSNQWVPCTVHGTHKSLFFNKTFIKNGSHGNIHTFKNYFAIMFSVFSKISGIQTDSK